MDRTIAWPLVRVRLRGIIAAAIAVAATGHVSAQSEQAGRAHTVLSQAARATAPGTVSAPLADPGLRVQVPRVDPFNASGTDYPDAAGDAIKNGQGGNNGARGWIWFGKACWIASQRRILSIHGPHPADVMGPKGPPPPSPGFFNPYLVIMGMYDEREHRYTTFEGPLSSDTSHTTKNWPRAVGHGFDNQCYVPTTGELIKATVPATYKGYVNPVSGTNYIQPQLARINVSALVSGNVASGRSGAAYVGSFPMPAVEADGKGFRTDVTAGAMDYLPKIDRIIHAHKDRFWTIHPVTGVHAPNHADGISLGFKLPDPARPDFFPIHNIGHYNPTVDKFIYGGGALAPAGYNLQFVAIDGTSLVVTHLDNSPATFSMSETNLKSPVQQQYREAKAAASWSASGGESVFFQDTGAGGTRIFALDTRRPAGQQWRLLPLTLSHEVDYLCPVPDYGIVVLFTSHSSMAGQATMRVYRHDPTPPQPTVSASGISADTIRVTITPGTGTGPPAARYEVLRSTSQHGAYAPIGTVSHGIGSIVIEDPSLSAGQTRWYEARPVGFDAQGPASAAVSGTTTL